MLPPSVAGLVRATLAVSLLAATAFEGRLHAQDTAPAPPARVQAEVDAAKLSRAGKHDEALEKLDEAAAQYARARDRSGQARVDVRRSVALRALGRLDEAAAAGRRARDLAAAGGDIDIQVDALVRLASIANDRGNAAEHTALLERALPLAQTGAARRFLPSIYEALGSLARRSGRTAEALEYQTSAIEAADAGSAPGPRVRARGARATTYLQAGRYDEALADAQRAYDLAAETSDRGLHASAAFGLAQVHAHLWNLDHAAELWTTAIEAYRATGLKIGVAFALRQRCDTWFAMGDLDAAADDARAALDALDAAGSRGIHPELLARLALIESRRGNRDEAAGYEARALALAEGPAMAPTRLRFLYNDLGLVAYYLGRHAEAIDRFSRTLRLSEELGDPEYQWRARHNTGRAALALGRPDEARAELERAVTILEEMRRGLPDAALRAAFLSDRTAAYATLVEALQAQAGGDRGPAVERALEVAEQARSRSFADLLAESQARARDRRLEAVVAEDRRFSQRLTALQKQLLDAPDAAARAARLADLRAAEREYEAHMVRVRRDNPAYASLMHPEPLAAREIASLAGEGEALVEFLFTEHGGFAWTARDGRVRSHAIPGARTIASQVRLLHALAAGDDEDGLQRVGAHLYDALLGPAAAQLEGARRLILVPSGPLQRLSFALLRTPSDRWLGEELALSIVPSATVLGELHARGARGDAGALLAFSAPPPADRDGKEALFGGMPRPEAALAHAGREVRDVARALGARADIRSGADALESAVKDRELARYGIIHFATHTIVNEIVPRRSAILLGADSREDGLLQLNEVPHLRLDAALVVLASCRSHLGRDLRGEGLSSLSRAFMHAGARAVLASLWEVDDAGTRQFMGHFYRALRGGAAPDEALQRARRAMIAAGGETARPATWAAFVVAGDARHPLFAAPAPSDTRALAAAVTLAGLAVVVIGVRWRRRRSRQPAGEETAGAGIG